jgi:hypothetical protein
MLAESALVLFMLAVATFAFLRGIVLLWCYA